MKTIIKTLTLILLVLGFQMVPVKATMSPIEISTPEQFMGMLDSDASYILTSDLDFSRVTDFVPLFPQGFRGTFDGQGYTIKNLSMSVDVDTLEGYDDSGMIVRNVGLFAHARNAQFKDLNLENFNFELDGSSSTLGFAGLLTGYSINNHYSGVHILASKITTGLGVPLIVGGLSGSHFSNSNSALSDITIDFSYQGEGQYVGGLIGSTSCLDDVGTSILSFQDIELKLDLNGGYIVAGLTGALASSSDAISLENVSIRGLISNIDNGAAMFGEVYNMQAMELTDVSTKINFSTLDSSQASYNYTDFIATLYSYDNTNFQLNNVLFQNNYLDSLGSAVSAFNINIPDRNRQTTNSYALLTQGFLSTTNADLISGQESLLSSTYVGFDFTSTWAMHPKFNNGIPYLRYNLGYLTFVTNGGSVQTAQPFFKGETIPMPDTPSYEGHTFDGWYTNIDLTTSFDNTSPLYESQTLYAKWIAQISNTENPVPELVEYSLPLADRLPDTGIDGISGMIWLFLGTYFYKKSKC